MIERAARQIAGLGEADHRQLIVAVVQERLADAAEQYVPMRVCHVCILRTFVKYEKKTLD
jgi:hypothetical protein